jgi:hypothetical protein
LSIMFYGPDSLSMDKRRRKKWKKQLQ